MHKRRPDIERKLRLRIAALKASDSIAQLEMNDPLGKWHRLKKNRKGQWPGAVSSNERIIIEPLKNGVRIIDIEEERSHLYNSLGAEFLCTGIRYPLGIISSKYQYDHATDHAAILGE